MSQHSDVECGELEGRQSWACVTLSKSLSLPGIPAKWRSWEDENPHLQEAGQMLRGGLSLLNPSAPRKLHVIESHFPHPGEADREGNPVEGP